MSLFEALIAGMMMFGAIEGFETKYPSVNGKNCELPTQSFNRYWTKHLMVGTWKGSIIDIDGQPYRWQTTFNRDGSFIVKNPDSGYDERGRWYVSGMIKTLITTELRESQDQPYEPAVYHENYILQEITENKQVYCDPEMGVTFEAFRVKDARAENK